MAAVLAYGEGARLSYAAAAVLWGLRPPPVRELHVTVAGRDVRRRDRIRAHSVAHLHPADSTRHRGIPTTEPARTLLDLAATASRRELDLAVNDARILHHVADHSLNEQFSRYPAHRGTRALRQAIHADPKLTRSEAEQHLLELIRAARLPEPDANVRVGRHEVDFLWREHDLVVEVDGFAFHSSRSSRRWRAPTASAGAGRCTARRGGRGTGRAS